MLLISKFLAYLCFLILILFMGYMQIQCPPLLDGMSISYHLLNIISMNLWNPLGNIKAENRWRHNEQNWASFKTKSTLQILCLMNILSFTFPMSLIWESGKLSGLESVERLADTAVSASDQSFPYWGPPLFKKLSITLSRAGESWVSKIWILIIVWVDRSHLNFPNKASKQP